MKTVIDLPEELLAFAAELAALEKRPLAEWVAAVLGRALDEVRREAAKEGDFTDWRGELL